MLITALKVKLMMRRPINQLVAQGIMPRECNLIILPTTYKKIIIIT